MRTGTRWHAVHPTYLSREYRLMKNFQQRHRPRASPCQCAWWSPATTWRLTADRAEVLIACPKCGETRLLEQLDGQRWFCAVCAHSWPTRNEERAPPSCDGCLPMLAPVPVPNDSDAFAKWSRRSTSEWMARSGGGHRA